MTKKNVIRTSKRVASKAGKLLKGSSAKRVKSVAGDALGNRRKKS